jgi:hypothetical protein
MKKQFLIWLSLIINQLLGHGLGVTTSIRRDKVRQPIEYLFENSCHKAFLVSSYDFDANIIINSPIKSVGESKSNCYFRISFDDSPHNDIICTPNQEFYDVNTQRWTPALQLRIGDELFSVHRTYAITSIEFTKKPLKVYMLEVDHTHNFFVGGNSILTHNMPIPWALSAGLGISFGAGVTAGGTAGGCFVPITLVGGAVIGGIICAGIKIFADGNRSKYSLHFDIDKIEEHLTTNVLYKEKLPGQGDGWRKLKGDQGWLDEDDNTWKKDQKHKNHAPHWDVSDRRGKKIKEVDYDGKVIWPNGSKNKNKKP